VLVEHDQLVQTFTPQRTDDAFGERVHIRRQLPAVAAIHSDFG
jgi:hypothetical protein